jgi:hypothetical protein
MDFNGQHRVFSFLETLLSDPAAAPAERLKLAEARRNRARNAALIQPVYLPLNFSMTAAASNLPYRATTNQLNYDVIIVGAKTNCWPGFGRQINFSLSDGQDNFVRTGNDPTLFLTTDDIAGSSVDASGNPNGYFYWTQPFLLQQGQTMLMEMMKTDATGAAELANVTLLAYRVFPKEQAAITIGPQDANRIDELIQIRPAPVSKVMKVAITYPAASVGSLAQNIYTPRLDDPVIIRGIRTNMSQSTIAIGLEGGSNWMPAQTPIWAVAAENQSQVENYIWGERGLYLPANTSMVINMINGNIDQLNFDPATGNWISFIFDTI